MRVPRVQQLIFTSGDLISTMAGEISMELAPDCSRMLWVPVTMTCCPSTVSVVPAARASCPPASTRLLAPTRSAWVDCLVLPYLGAVVVLDGAAAVVAHDEAFIVSNLRAAVAPHGPAPVHPHAVASQDTHVAHQHRAYVEVVGTPHGNHLEQARALRVADAYGFGFHAPRGQGPVAADAVAPIGIHGFCAEIGRAHV